MRRQASVALALVYGAITSHVYARHPLDVKTCIVLVTLPLTSVVLLLLSFRAISIDEAVHARLTHNLRDYRASLGRSVILSNDGFATLVRLLLSLNLLTSVPVAWNRYSNSEIAEHISGPFAGVFGVGSLLISAMCILLSVTQPPMEVRFDDATQKSEGYPAEFPDALVPIKVLAPYLIRHAGADGWHKVGHTSRRHDIHAKVDKDTQTYEIRTVWSDNHPAMAGSSAPSGAASPVSMGLTGKLSDL
ncbi:hypothetical protein ACQY0O_000456 [Thecaphora frezii]